jgi:hypothetical protein
MLRANAYFKTFVHLLALVAAASLMVVGTASADEGKPAVSKTPASAELSRFIEAQITSKQREAAAVSREPAVTCEADQTKADSLAAIQNLEMSIAAMQKQQLDQWEKLGLTPKEAAEAGHSVVLNGKGYNAMGSAKTQ